MRTPSLNAVQTLLAVLGVSLIITSCESGGTPSGTPGTAGTGAAGATGAAGNATGAAGNATGAAGNTTGAAGMTTGAAGTGAAGAGVAGVGAAGTGVAGTGVAGAGAAGTGAAGTGAAGTGAAGVAGGLYNGPFTCSMYIGAYLSMEWYGQGFEAMVGDGTKWELKWHHHGHITEWAKPDSPFWANTGDPNNDAMGSPIQTPCAMNSTAPDRIVFLAISWALTTEEQWITNLNADIANIKAKFPSAKRVDLMTMIRCPMNQKCNPNAVIGGPDSDTNAQKQDCQVPAYADSAIQKVIAANPTFVALGPQFEMTMCNPSHDGAHMTGADNKIAATKIAAFYAAKP